jgi:hypothetical protein
VYSRKVDGKVLTFGHEGILYKNSFVLYDRQSRSLWLHTTGEAVHGPQKGKQLQFVPCAVTTWRKWKMAHPDTLVLPGRKAEGFMGAFNLNRDRKRYGLSVGQGKRVKLFPFQLLEKKGLLNDELFGTKIVVVFDKATGSGVAFERGDLIFQLKDNQMVDQKGRAWNLLLGRSGEESLTPIPATPWLLERWAAFFRQQAEK